MSSSDRQPHASGEADDLFAPGEVFASRYRMVTRLGQGLVGDVWRADDLVLGIPVAIKVLHTPAPGARRLLLNETLLARRITHPAVCRVFDVGEERGHVFLSMELVDGEDLAALVHRVGRLPGEKVADIGRQLCEALAAAHAQGILHRDLNPANVLIDQHGSVRIADFGLAVVRGDGGRHTGVGTDGYMAPEQLASGGAITEQTDLYALGVVLYELLVGRHPHDQPGVHGRTRRPSTLAPGIDPQLERVVLQALSPDPRDRPASAVAMEAQLAACAEAAVGPRRRSWPAVAVAGAVAAAIAALALTYAGRRSRPPLSEQDTILLTNFANTTSDPVFDGALKVALAVAMEQSPFLKVFPDDRVREALRLMNRAPDEPVTPQVAREIAQRERLKALLTGSIASLGRNYVIAIEAVNAQTGDVMAREQMEVTEKEQVLGALGQAAARLREKLGESLASIQKFDVPLPRATTPSLEALHAYALALDQDRLVARAGAIPHLNRALELDPGFALAQALLSGIYANSRRSSLAPDYSRRAFALRDRVSERERFFISWRYYHDAEQDWDKAFELAQSWTRTYPREAFAFNSLGAAFSAIGRPDQAIDAFRTAARLDMFVVPLENLAVAYMALNRFEDAKEVVRQASARAPELVSLRRVGYLGALVDGDEQGMAREIEAARRAPDAMSASDWEARRFAFGGRVLAAHDQFRTAVRRAVQAELRESAAQWSAVDAEGHALVGQCADARRETAEAVGLSRDNFTLERSARALALCGAGREVSALSRELTERFPNATLTSRIQLPVAAAALALRSGDAPRALATLEPVKPYDRARGAEFWPAYLRGQAYLASKDGRAAAEQFEAIVNHRGLAADSPLYALAHAGLARAAAITGNAAKARSMYEAFFALWRDADADAAPLQEARAEYARLR